ncbi:MAG: kelch repeat-containing protein [Burkholderiales bacterium]|nr:MAG: kelch repeat-containing protein [Burkholderiales bacterium]
MAPIVACAAPDGPSPTTQQATTSLAWTQSNTSGAPTARHESSAAKVGDAIYVIGGRGQRPLDILDLKTGAWRSGAAPPIELNHAQAVSYNGSIYVVGALTGPFPEETVVPNIMIYDPALDQWRTGPEIPADRRRGGAGVTIEGDVLYMIGGNRRGHMSGYVAWTDAFDLKSQTWSQLPDAPRPRDHFHAAALDGKIYAAGGRRSSHDTGDDLNLTVAPVDVFDVASRTWSTIAKPLPTPRAGVAVAAAGGRLIVIGGESAVQQPAHAEVEAYDPARDAWTTLPPLPVGRHGTQAVTVDDAVHIIAGSRNRGGGPELADHWVLD